MSELYPVIFGFIFIAILGAVSVLFLYLLNPPWWKHRWVRLAVYIIPLLGGIAIILWALGVKSGSRFLTGIGATGAAMTAVVEIALLLSLPVSGAFQAIGRILRKIRHTLAGSGRIDKNRRLVLKSAAAAFPLLAISTGVGGVVRSFKGVRLPLLSFSYLQMPPALEGLKILQLSDSHLGFYVVLEHLEKLLIDAEKHKPDIVLITGDVADDLSILPEALKMISQLNPPLGCYACLGNHEYYRGIDEVRRIYDKAPVSLLVNEGTTIDVDGTALYIAGVDDPRWMSRDNSRFLHDSVDKCLEAAPGDAFKIFMCHRPEGFDRAAGRGVELTLAGHTHGGQIGIGGKSFFEMVSSYKYLWGHYIKGNGSQLYTTSGVGHWFPFRLGCPQEAPLIELKKGREVS